MVGLDDLLSELDVGVDEGVDRVGDHLGALLAHGDELILELIGGLLGHLLDEEGGVAGHAVDVREVRDDAERAGNEAQVVADERLLEQHGVETGVLDALAQAVLRLAAVGNALLGATVSRGGEAGGANVRHALLLEANDEVLDAIELLRELGTGLHNHIS